MIPSQLQNGVFRFVLLKPKDKRPFEQGWQNQANYRYDDPKLLAHIQAGANYGCLAGRGGLIVLDCDDPNLELTADDKLPKTFKVRTGSGKAHFYFQTDDLTKVVLTREGKHYGELQGNGSQVVGPGSTHPTGNQYTVETDCDLAYVSREQLKAALAEFWPEERMVSATPFVKSDFEGLRIEDVVRLSGFNKLANGEMQGAHPFHKSDTGHNFNVNLEKQVWHCWQHDHGGNALTLLAIKEGIINCGDDLRGEDFKKTLAIAREKYGLMVADHQGDGVPKSGTAPQEGALAPLGELATLLLQDRRKATELIVQKIKSKERIFTIRDDEASEIYIYKDGIYQPHGKTFIQEYCRQLLGEAYTTQFTNEVIAKIIADTFTEAKTFFNQTNKIDIVVQNGILNIFTRTIRPYTPDEIFFEKLPVTYDPAADCPNFKKHLETILSSPEDINVMCEIIGFTLYNEYKYEKAFLFYGVGRNGKGKTTETIKRMLGAENVSAISLHQLEEDNFAAAELFHKRANICGEMNDRTLNDASKIKGMTGRDYISAARKYLPHLNFTNNAKFIFPLNAIPPTRDNSAAFFSRWIPLDFPFRFVTQEEYDVATPEEREKWKIMDSDIISKLTTQAELNGLLNFALNGVQRLEQQKGFSCTKTMKEIEVQWKRRSSSFTAFLMDCVEENYDSNIPKKKIASEYSNYCRKYKLRRCKDKQIADFMADMFGSFEEREYISDIDGKKVQERVWKNVRFKDV